MSDIVINPNDLTLKCRDCKCDFVFTEGEQKFYSEKQLTNPSRCKACRASNKAKKFGGLPPPPPQTNNLVRMTDYATAPPAFADVPRPSGKEDRYEKPEAEISYKKKNVGSKRRSARWDDED